MTKLAKTRVAVLSGGQSGEHDVSMISAANVMQHLDRDRFQVILIKIDRDGTWWVGDDKEPQSAACLFAKDRPFDVVFPAVHGTLCEDGTLQGLLEQAAVPYVGCGVLASAIGMDKDVSKRLVREAGISIAPYIVLRQQTFARERANLVARINEQMNLPLFVKPANTGSSVGIEKITQMDQLMAAILNAFQHDSKVLIEQGIDARELEVAVLESPNGEEPIASIVGEIRPNHAFYSYEAKYLDDNGADLLVPAEIDETTSLRVQALAKAIFSLLECEGMARIDFFLDRQTGHLLFNEINTIPGFTFISMYPRLLMASGIPYSDLLSRLIDLALDRHAVLTMRRKKYNQDVELL